MELSKAYAEPFPSAAVKPLMDMAQGLDKKSIRSYGNVIGVCDGFACITNGHALLQSSHQSFAGINGCFNSDLTPSAVKFPAWQACLKKIEKPNALDAVAAWELFSLAAKAKNPDVRFVPIGGVPMLKIRPTEKFRFKPELASLLIKALPKAACVNSAEIHEDVLFFEFSTGHTLVLVAEVTHE